ncbi:MAG: glycogen synthase [Treponema sp.]|nr:glycogen synthase [Treponema sp.]
MKILMISAEVVPFAKTGGLADAVSALSIALEKAGHDVKIIMPRYYKIDRKKLTKLDGPLGIPFNYNETWSAVYTTTLPGSNSLPVYFIDHEQSFGREGVYGNPLEPDFHDNVSRFSILCNSAFQLCHKLNWYPEIIHSHDWSASLANVLLKFNQRWKPEFAHTASILTIHNLGYQGNYDKINYPKTGLDWINYHTSGFEDYGRMNFLKAGLISSDILTTVSPTYAEEIQTFEGGFGLDGILRYRNKRLFGILNGVDTEYWNPEKDKRIKQNYTVKSINKKMINKKFLQEKMGLEVNENIPVIGIITRLVAQKGIAELFAPTYGSAYNICASMNVQMVVLGSGETWCEDEIRNLQAKLPNFRAYIGYDEDLSHQIEAGSDFFLMPSKYEPCGLNQMYSLLYGTLPIVRRTGGLADTVQQYCEKTGEGTGFLFDNLTPQSIYDTVGWAVYAWYNKREHIEQMKIRGMKKDFTWDKSAKEYKDVYKFALKNICY